MASSSLAEERKKEDSEKLKALVRDCDLLEEDKNQRECELVLFQARKGGTVTRGHDTRSARSRPRETGCQRRQPTWGGLPALGGPHLLFPCSAAGAGKDGPQGRQGEEGGSRPFLLLNAKAPTGWVGTNLGPSRPRLLSDEMQARGPGDSLSHHHWERAGPVSEDLGQSLGSSPHPPLTLGSHVPLLLS